MAVRTISTLDPTLRAQMRAAWNTPRWTPVAAVGGLFLLTAVPAIRLWRKRLRASAHGDTGRRS